MTDDDNIGVTDLLDRATRTLTLDVPDLVARAAVGGRRTRRRNLAATAVAALALAGVSTALVPSVADLVSRGDAGAATITSHTGSTRRHLAVSTDQLAETLSSLLPAGGERTDLSTERNKVDGVRYGSLTWQGARITIGIDDAADPLTDDPGGTYTTGPSPSPRPAPTTPEAWCRAMSGDRCHALPNGDWATSSDAAEPGNPSNFQTFYALYTTDGYLIFAQAAGLDPHVDNAATHSPLTPAQVQAVVDSDVWLTD